MPDPTPRSSNREVENENLRPSSRPGEPPRPATEPPGVEESVRSAQTKADPGSGTPRPHDAEKPG